MADEPVVVTEEQRSEAYLDGVARAREGAPADANPHSSVGPTEALYLQWLDGWTDGTLF